MGGKSKAPAAPDYGPLAAASEKSAEYAYQTAQEQMAWAKEVYADNKAVGDQVIDFALGQMEKQSAWADADRKKYEEMYQPLEEQAALRAQDYASAERQEFEAGKAEADVAAQFEQARQTAAANLEQFGVDPSQTRQGALDLGTRVAEAAAQASAGNQARFRTEQYGDQLIANAINTGKGYPQQVLAAAGQAGASGNQATNTGLATTASGAQTMGTPGSWQTAGNQAIGQWGQILNAGFQNRLAQHQADQASSSGWGSAMGTALSLIPMMAQEGGAIPDPSDMGGGPVPIEASPSGGAIPDDIPAEIEGGQPARLNAGEFVMPKRTVAWLGEKGMQAIIAKADKEMGIPPQPPAEPEMGGPGGPPPGGPPPIPPRGVGAIPELEGVA
jgi:hypothetical protein